MRQVYFDPFGSRLEGFQQGVRDESGLQAATRTARASDWDYNNMAPLRLRAETREQNFQDYADPYRRQLQGLGVRQTAANLFGTEQPLYERVGQVTGNYAAPLANAHNFGLGTDRYLQSPQYFAPQVMAYDQQIRGGLEPGQDEYEQMLGHYAQQYGVDPRLLMGAMRANPFQITPQAEQGYDQFLGFDRARQIAADNLAYNNNEWQRQVQQQTLQNQADAQAASRAWFGLQSGYANGTYGNGGQGGYQGYSGAEDGF